MKFAENIFSALVTDPTSAFELFQDLEIRNAVFTMECTPENAGGTVQYPL